MSSRLISNNSAQHMRKHRFIKGKKKDQFSDSLSDIFIDNNGLENSDNSDDSTCQENDLNIDEEDDIIALKKWAILSKTPKIYLDALLKILRRKLLPSLPKCSKTFLKTTQAKYTKDGSNKIYIYKMFIIYVYTFFILVIMYFAAINYFFIYYYYQL